MKIAAISDLHVGARSWTDSFRHDVSAFQRFLDRLEATHDRIVLLGDIWQCDHGLLTSTSAQRRALAAAQARAPWLSARLEDPRYALVHGNHDAIAQSAMGAETTIELSGAAAAVLLTHGDRYDPVIATAPGISAAATWFCGRARSLGLRPVASWLEERDIAIKGARFQTPEGPYAAAARALMRERGAQIVVFGHTHVPWRVELPEGVLLNTGSCSRGRFMYASMDLDSGRAEVVVEPAGEG